MLKFLQDSFAFTPASATRRSPAGRLRAITGTALIACAWSGVVQSPAAAASTEQVLWSFGSGTDGKDPYAGLLYDGTAGVLYGTTSGGGTYKNGTLFSLNPYTQTNPETVLWSFGNGKDSNAPYGNVISVNGELYGATTGGGYDDVGTVFSFDLQAGTDAVLHSFDVSNGQSPYSLVKVKDRLYGTTPWGGPGTNYAGTVYDYDMKTGRTKVLYYFAGGTDSSHPYGALINVSGMLYGTASAGGQYGYGAVFSFDPATNNEAVLWSFGSGTDGQNPNRSLINVKGTLYGTTVFGGLYEGGGTVFSLNPATQTETVLWSFGNGTDGQYPECNLVYVKGTFYGTTLFGGSDGAGTVFSLVP